MIQTPERISSNEHAIVVVVHVDVTLDGRTCITTDDLVVTDRRMVMTNGVMENRLRTEVFGFILEYK